MPPAACARPRCASQLAQGTTTSIHLAVGRLCTLARRATTPCVIRSLAISTGNVMSEKSQGSTSSSGETTWQAGRATMTKHTLEDRKSLGRLFVIGGFYLVPSPHSATHESGLSITRQVDRLTHARSPRVMLPHNRPMTNRPSMPARKRLLSMLNRRRPSAIKKR